MCFFVVNSSASVYEFTSGTKSFDGFLGRSIFARDADRLFFPNEIQNVSQFSSNQCKKQAMQNSSKQCKLAPCTSGMIVSVKIWTTSYSR
jgi:hypothetical protein